MSNDTFRECRSKMDKTIEHFELELRGIRTGRASTALVEFLKVECYGSLCDLRDVAGVSVPEPTQILVKPFDPTTKNPIAKAIESAELGLNPQVEGDAIRIHLPPPSAERRKQLCAQVKKLAEDSKIAIRNERRDGVKQVESLVKDKSNSFSEDLGKISRSNIDDLTRDMTKRIEDISIQKTQEIEHAS
ncbi:MAG: ribosome recycling factor [Phycisphaerales bacterium]|nr:ribosome recycling factor [Phycisphaerales bacterium]